MEGVHEGISEILRFCLTRPVHGIKQLRVEITSGVLRINLVEGIRDVWVVAINTIVYFVEPEGIIVDERVRRLEGNRDWNVDDLLTGLAWNDWYLSTNFGWN